MTIYANVFIPDYASGDDEYTPWVLTHEDADMLAPTVLEAKFEEFRRHASTNGDEDEEDILENFYNLLGAEGYGTYYHHDNPAILDM